MGLREGAHPKFRREGLCDFSYSTAYKSYFHFVILVNDALNMYKLDQEKKSGFSGC